MEISISFWDAVACGAIALFVTGALAFLTVGGVAAVGTAAAASATSAGMSAVAVKAIGAAAQGIASMGIGGAGVTAGWLCGCAFHMAGG